MPDNTPPEQMFQPSVVGKISSVSHQKLIPYSVILELTHRCNEKCLHCYLDHPSKDKVKQELTTAEICGILDQLAEAGTLHLSITGGEGTVTLEFSSEPEITAPAFRISPSP